MVVPKESAQRKRTVRIVSNLSSKSVEQKVLSALLIAPYHMRILNMDLGIFAHKENRKLADLIRKYVEKHRKPPTKDTITIFANDLATEANIEEIGKALTTLDDLPKIDANEADFYFDKAENYRIGRSVYDINQYIHESFENNENDFRKIRKNILSQVLSSGTNSEHIRRGFLHDNVKERFTQYEQLERGDKLAGLIPFGIKSLDKVLGGMRKSFVTLLYSKTGGGKTRTSINLAYNAAVAGYRVMYFTLEMAFNMVANCFDSRMALIDSGGIVKGRLDSEDKYKFFKTLKNQMKEKLGIWLVDIPRGAKSSTILEELELYKDINGCSPDLIVIDYANLMVPMTKYQDRSEKYSILFRELHEIARFEDIALVTATQEKRIKSDSKKKNNQIDEDDEGVDNIGLSAGIAFHCEIVIRLKQDKYDMEQQRLWAIIDKDRYGKNRQQIRLHCDWSRTYVGDDHPAPIRIKKEA